MRTLHAKEIAGNALPAVHSLVLHWVDRIALFFVPGGTAAAGPRKKVLFIRLDAIGDFILWLDAAKEIRTLFPADRCRITLLGNGIWTPLAEDLAVFDEVLALDRDAFVSNPVYRRNLLARVRRSGFDVVIHPTFSREFLFGDSVVRFCGARERIGYEGDCSNILPFLKRISDTWYTRLVPASGKRFMELERNAEFLRAIGLPSFRCGVPDGRALFPRPRSAGSPAYYVLFPGAGSPLKQWPVECFAELAAKIHKATGWTGVIAGGPDEERIGKSLRQSTDAPLEDRTGRTTLRQLGSMIAGARLVVTNDTSAVHIAAAVSTPAVCITGGGHPGRFVPYRVETPADGPLPIPVTCATDGHDCNWRCAADRAKDEPAPCVTNVSVNDAWNVVRKVLADIDGGASAMDGMPSE